MASWIRVASFLAASSAAVLTAGCADSLPSLPKFSDINPFAEKQVALTGKRIPIMETTTGSIAELAPADRPVIVPAPVVNDSWPQAGGNARNAPGNVTLNTALKQVWSADAGAGSSKTGRLMASPIVYDGRVYTIDAQARVSAFSLSGGSVVWRTPLMPDKEAGGFSLWGSSGGGGGFGGGVAADNGRLFAATGFGTVVALDAKTGKKLWEKSVEAPVRAAPNASADRVFIITSDGRFLALAASDGNELWSSRGLPEQAFLINSASPAVDGDVVVAPFPSGEIIGLRVGSGQNVWTESLTRGRTGTADGGLSNAARPAIDGGTVYAVGHGGRMVATLLRNGERLWNINLSSTQAPAVVGEAVYVVDTTGQLRALNRRDGNALWTVKLPGSSTWSGPTAAGSALWAVSKDGNLVAADAATGRIVSQLNLGTAVFIPPIVAQGRMFVLTDNARLIALN